MSDSIPKKRTQGIFAVFLTIMLIFLFAGTAYAKQDQPSVEFEYYGEVVVSAYYPAEDEAYRNNYQGIPLTELVGDIVAAPTGSDLIGKYVIIAYEQDGNLSYLLRRVEDTGCKEGRIDLLVEDEAAMCEWGLREASIYVIEDDDF